MELPRLTVLNEQYAIRRLLGEVGPFEAIYLAWDLENEQQVIVHEFLPDSLLDRVLPSQSLSPNSNEARSLFDFGKKNLAKELKLRAQLSHPNVVNIQSFFEENNTLYSIHDYHPGTSLQNVLDHNGGKMSPKTAITIMMPFMDGVRVGHESRMLHGRISPESVFLSKQGRPMVLSFNMTYLFLSGKMDLDHTIQLHGFSPPEQYSKHGKPGPWSDVYGCAATLFTMLTGEVLPDAYQRQRGDTVETIIRQSQDVPDALRDHLITALSLNTNKRHHSIQAFSNSLAESLSVGNPVSIPAPDDNEIKKNLSKPPSDFQSNPTPRVSATSVPNQSDREFYKSTIRPPRPAHANTSHFENVYTGNEGKTVRSENGVSSVDHSVPSGDAQPASINRRVDPIRNGASTKEDHTYTPSATENNTVLSNNTYASDIPTRTFEDLNLKPVFKKDHLPATSSHFPSISSENGLTETSPYPKKRTYEQIDPAPTFEYEKKRAPRSTKTGHIVLYGIATGLIVFLGYLFVTNYLHPEQIGNYNNSSGYAALITRGDSLYDLAFNTQDAEQSLQLYRDARENYLASQQIKKEPLIKRRIVDIEAHLLQAPIAQQQLDEKASLAIIASGDSLLRVAERISLQGDSVQANILYGEARQKYFMVFEAFPTDSLANARLRTVNILMTTPARVPQRQEPTAQPVAAAPTDEQIQEKLFILFKDQGDAALDSRNYDEARRNYIDALKQKPGDSEVSRLLEETQRALATSLRREKFRGHMTNGNALLSQDRLTEARREYELALQALPDNDDAKQQIFIIDTRLKDKDKRQKDYLSFRTRGDLLLEQKKYEEALASYEAALEAVPDDEYALAKVEETKKDIESLKDYTPDLPPGMVDENGVFNYTEQPAELIGGLDVLQSRIRYPAAALNANIEGRVVLQMLVDETGQMSSPSVIKSLGYGCDEEALRVIRGARFAPARVGGRPVPSWHRMFFEFKR